MLYRNIYLRGNGQSQIQGIRRRRNGRCFRYRPFVPRELREKLRQAFVQRGKTWRLICGWSSVPVTSIEHEFLAGLAEQRAKDRQLPLLAADQRIELQVDLAAGRSSVLCP